MSTAAAATPPADAPAPKQGKKKLIIIVAAALLVVLLGGGAAYFFLKKTAHVDEDGDETSTSEIAEKGEKANDHKAATKRDPKVAPVYLPLEVFTVNLADREADRYAQIGITLELNEAKAAEQLKVFMPAIRNNILMVLAHKSSQELLEREGKQKLAGEVQRAASRALGIDVKEPVEEAAVDEKKPKKKKAKKLPEVVLPVLAVHFSNFIVQ